MEGLIFGECDEWYERAGKTKGCSVMQSQRAGAWALLSDGAKDHVMQRLRATLMDRFVTAVDNSDSYELDEMESVQITPRLPPKPMDDTTLSNTASVPSARGSRKDDVDTEDDSRQLYSSTNSGGATLPMGGLEGGLGRGGGGGAGGWEQPAKASPPQSYEGRGWDSESEEKPAARLSPRSQFVHINSDNAKEGSVWIVFLIRLETITQRVGGLNVIGMYLHSAFFVVAAYCGFLLVYAAGLCIVGS